MGLTIAAMFTSLFFNFLVSQIDWEKVIDKAQKRLNQEEVSSDTEEDTIDAPSKLDREFSCASELPQISILKTRSAST